MKTLLTSLALSVALSLTATGCAFDTTESTDGTSLSSEADAQESVGEAASADTVYDACQSPLVCLWTQVPGGWHCTWGHWYDSTMAVKNYCDGTCNHLVQSCAPKPAGTCTLTSGQVISCGGSTTG